MNNYKLDLICNKICLMCHKYLFLRKLIYLNNINTINSTPENKNINNTIETIETINNK